MDEFHAPARLAWATGRLAMESPLVNNYKKPFIIRRLIETFLGGLRLFASDDVPFYVYLLQILLFSVIPFLSIACVLLGHSGVLQDDWDVYICGIVEFLYALLLQILAYFLRKQRSKVEGVEHVNLAIDEEYLEFDSPFGPKTWCFLIREKRSKINILFHSLVVGVVGGWAIYYIRPEATLHLNVAWGANIALTVLGIITVSVGLWPLIGGAPPEPANFHPLSWDLPALSRPAHMLICILVHFLTTLYPSQFWLHIFDVFCHLVFVTSPLLWILGILPPIDALILWSLEQWIVIALGGSPLASSGRLIIQAVFGTLALCIVAIMPSFMALMVTSSCFGFLLSIDIAWLLSSLLSPHVKMLTGISGKYEEMQPIAGNPSFHKIACRSELILYFLLFCAVIGMSLGCQLPHSDWYAITLNDTVVPSGEEVDNRALRAVPVLFKSNSRDAVGSLVVVIAFSTLILNELQKIYLFGVFRNPVYAFCKRLQKNSLLYIISQMLQIGGPLVSLIFVHQVVSASVHQQMSLPFQTFAYFLLIIPLFRILRQIWQFPQPSYIQLSVFFLLEIIHRFLPSNTLSSWGTFSPATRIFFVSLGYLWGTRLLERIWMIILFLTTPLAEKKQQTALLFFLIGFNIALSPFLLALLALSSILSAPVLPLFTLPIFFLGFPRPLRFWSYPVGRSSNSCDDSVYYEQLTPHTVFALHNLLQTGSLGIVQPGDHFLLRWEDRLLWIQVLECGFTYLYYSVKGLELQETSCHTAEASRVDASFSKAFDTTTGETSSKCATLINSFVFHALTPLSQINVIGYSDTKNVLTGVIDSPDTLHVINDYFHKALLYVLMEFITKKADNLSVHQEKRSALKSRDSSRSKSYDVLTTLPRLEKRAEQHFEEEIPRATIELKPEKDKSSSVASRLSHASHRSQSGRGSRVAWVDGQISNNPLPALPAIEKTSRPSSWDDDEDPLDNRVAYRNGISTLSNDKSVIINNKDHRSTFPPIRPRPLNHTTSLEDLTEDADEGHFIPGLMYDDSSDEDTRHANRQLNQKVTLNPPKQKGQAAPVIVRVISQSDSRTPIYNSPLSAALAPSHSWLLDLPYESDVIDEVQDTFPHSWFKFLLNHFGREYMEHKQQASAKSKSAKGSGGTKPSGEKDDHIQKLQYDEDLEESYRIILGACHLIILGSENSVPLPTQVHKTYAGEVPWSMALDWLLNKQDLYCLVLLAYRIGVKLSLDHTLIGSISGWPELKACMEDYTQNWYFGPDNKSNEQPVNPSLPTLKFDDESPQAKSWMEAVRMEVPNLFSLGYNPVKGVFTSHLLSLGDAEVSIGRLSSETVRSLWASLVMELLYFTNDDDERYSIQAQPGLLRNLTIQAADPPLGYPIFSSSPLRLAVPWLSAIFQQISSSEKKEDN